MTRKPFRLLRALCNAFPRGVRVKSRFVSGGRVWLTPLLLGPACALALDIGEIQVHSALNQLFDARIPLPALTPEELGKVSVKLAPAPMFREFDLERAPALTNLVFSVEYNADGQVYVKVISTKPIQEPSLGLLVEFSWPRGKTFREFTVFLDPVQRVAQRPGDRSKTVLNTPAAAPEPSVEPAPRPESALAAVAARPEPEQGVRSDSGGEPAATVIAQAAGAPDRASHPMETPSAPVRVYRPGDTYGPVAAGEGLWGIALKVRPDPGITREQMMQALFQANPHAFSKVGISGLKTGSMLRLPSFREIADLTGSAAARQLAEIGPATAVAAAAPPSPAPAALELKTAPTVANPPEVFPLEPPAPLEPMAVMEPSAAPAPEAAQPAPAPAIAASEPMPPASDAVAAKPEMTQPGPEAVAAASEPVAPAFEPAVAEPEPAVAEFAVQPAIAEPIQEIALELISVTPLLFLAISEMMAAVVEPPAVIVAEAEPVTFELEQAAPTAPKSSVLASEVEPSAPVSTTMQPLAAPMDATALLASVEKHWLYPERDSLLQAHVVSDVTFPMVAGFAETLPVPAMLAGAGAASSAAETENSKTAVSGSPRQVAAGPAEPPAKTAEPSPSPQVYKGGDLYGPVTPNERLWDIATKVRPGPAVGKEVMMKALFKANPQAFSKANNMDSLKVGATLRIPTLQEIVEYTGSKAASQLLKQQQTAETPPAVTSEPAAAPLTPAAETAPAPASTPEPAAPPPPAAEAAPAPAAAPPPIAAPSAPAPAAEPPPIAAPPAPTAETAPAPISTPEPAAPAPAAEPPPIAAPPAPTAETAPAPISTPEPAAPAPAAEPPPIVASPAPVPAAETAPAPASAPEPAAPAPTAETAPAPASAPEPAAPAPAAETAPAPASAPEPAAPAPAAETTPAPTSTAEPAAPPVSDSSAPATGQQSATDETPTNK